MVRSEQWSKTMTVVSPQGLSSTSPLGICCFFLCPSLQPATLELTPNPNGSTSLRQAPPFLLSRLTQTPLGRFANGGRVEGKISRCRPLRIALRSESASRGGSAIADLNWQDRVLLSNREYCPQIVQSRLLAVARRGHSDDWNRPPATMSMRAPDRNNTKRQPR